MQICIYVTECIFTVINKPYEEFSKKTHIMEKHSNPNKVRWKNKFVLYCMNHFSVRMNEIQ